MKIDIFNHIFPKKFFDKYINQGSGGKDIGKRVQNIQTIVDELGPLPTAKRKLRVVLDACNGAGSIAGPKLLAALGAVEEAVPA